MVIELDYEISDHALVIPEKRLGSQAWSNSMRDCKKYRRGLGHMG